MQTRKFFGYHKSYIKNLFSQIIRINICRLIGSIIKNNVQITKGTRVYPSNYIGQNSKLLENVTLSEGVHIGNNCSISNIKIGENSFIDSWVVCTGCGDGIIILGKESYVGIANILDWSDNITIGDYVHIAGSSTGLWTHSSYKMCLNCIPINNKSEEYRPKAPIIIESNVYIGGNCTIYPGITVGHHSIVAPNSAVTKDVPPFTMVGGVPARKIKDLNNNQ